MKLTTKQLENLYFEEEIEVDGVTLKVVESGDWVHDHKFQSKEVIFTDGERFFSGYIGRSGSEFSDWTYESEIYGAGSLADIDEVEKVEVVRYEWHVKKEATNASV